jgi:putative peptidoglycan lipid II flippase
VFDRIWSLTALVLIGAGVFFAVAYLAGALDKDLIALLRRRTGAAEPVAGD